MAFLLDFSRFKFLALVAQSAEHLHGKEGVIGSSPIEGLAGQHNLRRVHSMAKSKKGNIELVALKCSECDRQNYVTKKNRRNIEGKLEFKKYCKFDKKHTLHVETRLK